ncbi:MAG: transglycosylase domain-containing protein [Chakrabartia sp.]
MTDRLIFADPLDPDAPDPSGGPETLADAPAPSPWRRRWLWFKRGVQALLALFVLLFVWLALTAPLSKSLQPIAPPQLTLLASNGEPIARNGANVGPPVKIKDLPAHVPQAFVAIEDRRFYSHWGIDPRGLARALVNNMGDGGTQGGSTITQQLAKITFLTPERSLTRKAREMLIAFWLEAWLTKDEILERYLSNVYFGDNAYGLSAASAHYFNKTPDKLTVSEAAMLAGLVQAPSRLAPTKNLEGARARAKLVLQAMAEAGFISEAQARAARPARLNVPPDTGPPSGTYFADWALPQVRAALDGSYGKGEVTTTLDARLQRIARSVVARAPLGDAQIALVAMKTNGEVVAMVGGKNYQKSPFNRATQARRQPGSTFKLFVYLAAMRAGMTPETMIEDTEITEGAYRPRNSGDSYRGTITLKRAFARSSNVAAVRLYRKLGDAAIIQAARDLGIKSPLAADPSLALGSSAVTLLELTSAYAAIAANEYPVEPHALPAATPGLFQRIINGKHGLGDKTHDYMLELLRATVIQGTGRAAGLTIPAYGKTGTSQNSRDALFIGFAGDLVVGVWIGRDDNKPLGGMHGGGLPAQIWRDFMGQAIAGAARPEEPENEQLPENAMENVTADLVPEVQIEGADVDLGEDPKLKVQGNIGGVDVNVNVNRNGVTVVPTQPAPPPPRP